MAPLTLQTLARIVLVLAVCLALATAAAYAALGSEVRPQAVQVAEANTPITIPHESGTAPRIWALGTGFLLDEERVIRLDARVIVVATPGTWVAKVGPRLAIWTVTEPAGPPEPEARPEEDDPEEAETVENPKPEETQLAEVPAELEPADGPTVWFLTGEPGKCLPCDKWKKEDMPVLVARGVTVHTVPRDEHSEATPTFIMAAVGKTPVQRTGRWANWSDAPGILEFLELD